MKILAVVSLLISSLAAADCTIVNRHGFPVIAGNNDPLFAWLTTLTECPKDVFEFREGLKRAGANLRVTMVANEGAHSPGNGSYSLFEMVDGALGPQGATFQSGEFFFGHFITPSADDPTKLIANQSPHQGSLMIELILWDPLKQAYNFYEMRGDGRQGHWVYQGDSYDIVDDTEWLYRERAAGQPPFGQRMRCSGCHVNGGPIMKELAEPYNDWWRTGRPLSFGQRSPDEKLSSVLTELADASVLSRHVRTGMEKLENSDRMRAVKEARSLQELLRPLFAPVELNLESDGNTDWTEPFIRVPGGFFVDPRLAGDATVAVSRTSYEMALREFRIQFPGTNRIDSQHAWLTPVKAPSDIEAISALREAGIVDQRFILAVLSVDFTNPVFSTIRSGLLKLLPRFAYAGWQDDFIENLRLASGKVPGAEELHANLTDFNRDADYFKERAARYIANVRRNAVYQAVVYDYTRVLMQRRREIASFELSQNPLGQILEPGFRVIFAESPLAPEPGTFMIREDGEVILTKKHLTYWECGQYLSPK